jgi:hypothetical protein
MPAFSQFQHVSAAPSNPQPAAGPKAFDVADLYPTGPVTDIAATRDGALPLDEKLRQACFWIVNHASFSPHYDLEYFAGPHQSYILAAVRQPIRRQLSARRLRAEGQAKYEPTPFLPQPGRPTDQGRLSRRLSSAGAQP